MFESSMLYTCAFVSSPHIKKDPSGAKMLGVQTQPNAQKSMFEPGDDKPRWSHRDEEPQQSQRNRGTIFYIWVICASYLLFTTSPSIFLFGIFCITFCSHRCKSAEADRGTTDQGGIVERQGNPAEPEGSTSHLLSMIHLCLILECFTTSPSISCLDRLIYVIIRVLCLCNHHLLILWRTPVEPKCWSVFTTSPSFSCLQKSSEVHVGAWGWKTKTEP